ncbi:DUF4160 domain-containing protein [Pigmentiphaga litoralis]|uniref:DUF4160 domain-containing protein n=1 Tax=Pigmentiphaga litoralis TaxID=516702 RepID=UPI0015C779B4|nr:DUF4160 domain-containing protein [Pigmentiphaga litoralis]
MVTVYRADGLRVVIYSMDHEPAHVHVYGSGHAKIDLSGLEGEPVLVWAEGMKHGEVRRAMKIVNARRLEFLTRWRELHGQAQ